MTAFSRGRVLRAGVSLRTSVADAELVSLGVSENDPGVVWTLRSFAHATRADADQPGDGGISRVAIAKELKIEVKSVLRLLWLGHTLEVQSRKPPICVTARRG